MMRKEHEAGGVAGIGIVLLACVGQFMVVLDISIVNVALPEIRAALGFGASGLQWVVNAYVLVLAGSLMLGGRLADIYGTRRVFVWGLALFSLSSLVGGLATSQEALVVSRAVQGFGAAILAPATLTIITTTFAEGHRRTRALATWTAVGVGGGAAGNIIGGMLTEFLSWRWILLVNVPIGAGAILLAYIWLVQDSRGFAPGRLDISGAILATLGLAALTFSFTRIEALRWDDPVTLIAIGIAILAMFSFVLVERYVAENPLVPLEIFRIRSVSTGNIIVLLAGACLIPMWYFLTLLMQNVLGYSPFTTGFAFLPHTLLTIFVGIWITPWLMQYTEPRKLVAAGALAAAAGFLWQGMATPDSGYIGGILGPAVLISTGSGLLNTPVTAIVTSGVDSSDAGAASGLMNTAKQAGGALGLAILVAFSTGLTSTETPGSLAEGYGVAFRGISLLLIVVAIVSLTLPGNRSQSGGAS